MKWNIILEVGSREQFTVAPFFLKIISGTMSQKIISKAS